MDFCHRISDIILRVPGAVRSNSVVLDPIPIFFWGGGGTIFISVLCLLH